MTEIEQLKEQNRNLQASLQLHENPGKVTLDPEYYEELVSQRDEIRRLLHEHNEQLKERVRWLEEGLKMIEKYAVMESAVATCQDCFGDPYAIRQIARNYLEEKK